MNKTGNPQNKIIQPPHSLRGDSRQTRGHPRTTQPPEVLGNVGSISAEHLAVSFKRGQVSPPIVRKEPVRFDSLRFRNFENSSVRFGSEIVFVPVRRGSACAFRARRGSVRFGSVPRPVPAGSEINRFGSADSVRFLIPSCKQISALARKRKVKVLRAQGQSLRDFPLSDGTTHALTTITCTDD